MEYKFDITIEDFKKLHYLAGWKPLDDFSIQKALDNSMLKISVFEDNECIGIARIVGDYSSHGLLSDVIISPDYQGKGYGTKMIQTLNEKLQEYVDKNCDEFILELLPTCGREGFYKSCGLKHRPESMSGMYKWFKNRNIYTENSKKFYLKLKQSPFDAIKSGKKTIEMRLMDEKRQELKVGDFIYFVLGGDYSQTIKVKIEKITTFKNFEELYSAFPKELLGYDKNEIANPKDMNAYYSQEDITKYGVCAIQIKLMP